MRRGVGALPVGAVGAVVYPGLTGGQLQQFVPLSLPLLLCVHQTRLRGGHKDRHAAIRLLERGVECHKSMCWRYSVLPQRLTLKAEPLSLTGASENECRILSGLESAASGRPPPVQTPPSHPGSALEGPSEEAATERSSSEGVSRP